LKPPNKKAAGAHSRGTLNTNDLFETIRLSEALRQVTVVTDDRAAKAIAVSAGVAVSLAAVPFGANRVSIAVGSLRGGQAAAIIRFHGWSRAEDSGWMALVGSRSAALRAAKILSRSIIGEGAVEKPGHPGRN
jgi:hypothetical protein